MAVSTETATEDRTEGAEGGTPAVAMVDPRAPRFGQSLTTLGFGAAIAFDLPALLYATTVVLVVPVLSGWRVDPYGLLWKRAVLPLVGRPAEREPAAPHRFARVMGAIFGTVGSALLLAGVPLAAYAAVGIVVVLAALAASTGICIGCRMYRQVKFFRDLGIV